MEKILAHLSGKPYLCRTKIVSAMEKRAYAAAYFYYFYFSMK